MVVASHASTVVTKRKIGLIHARGNQAEPIVRPMMTNKETKKMAR